MSAALTSRRHLIVSGLMTWASVWLPASSLPVSYTPGWLAPLIKDLAGLSTWMRTEFEADGMVIIHCGARDFSGWAARAGALAGRDRKVSARGNTLTLVYLEKQVRIVIHPDIA